MTKEARRYYREINTLIPSKGHCGKSVLESIKMRIEEIESTTENVTYESFCEILGEPKTVITNYYGIVDIDELVKKLRFAKRVRACSFAVLAAFIAVSITVAAYYHHAYEQNSAQVVEYNENEIPD